MGIHLSLESRLSVHQSVLTLEACCLACKIIGSRLSCKQLQDRLQVFWAHRFIYRVMNISQLGKGSFRIQFESSEQAEQALAQGPLEFHSTFGIFERWRQGMDLSCLGGRLVVTVRFPGLLPEFVSLVPEISRSLGFVLFSSDGRSGDRTITSRVVLHPSLVQDPPRFISLPSVHGGEVLQRVFFIGLPGHCFICGIKGHLASGCTRRRVSSDLRHEAVSQEAQAQVGSPVVVPRAEVPVCSGFSEGVALVLVIGQIQRELGEERPSKGSVPEPDSQRICGSMWFLQESQLFIKRKRKRLQIYLLLLRHLRSSLLGSLFWILK